MQFQRGLPKQENKGALSVIDSQQFTLQMAVNCLYEWGQDSTLMTALLARIKVLLHSEGYRLLPTILLILAEQHPNSIISLCQELAIVSLPCYLLTRWAYRTYTPSSYPVSLLDNMVMNPPPPHPLPPQDALVRYMQLKQQKMQYVTALNQYYQQLAQLSYELKDVPAQQRDERLRDNLMQMMNKMTRQEYQKGVALPTLTGSNLAVRMVIEECRTYPTKDRVSYKVVYETISPQLHDAPLSEISQLLPDPNIRKSPPILPHSYFGPLWHTKLHHIASNSPFSVLPSHRVTSFMVKSGDDLRQQHLAMELITMVHDICKRENVKLWLRPYHIILFSQDAGLIEFIEDTRTLSYLKEKSRARSLKDIFLQLFGEQWEGSLGAFVESLAGYSLVQYLFQIKDRHNNNILLDSWGHLLHIDYAFIIGHSPGHLAFEKAPFKLTQDYLDLMGGSQGDLFQHFKLLFFLGLKYVGKYRQEIVQRVELMKQCADLPCLKGYDRLALERRFFPGLGDEELRREVEGLVAGAVQSRTTTHYDVYQWVANDIYR